MPKPAIQILVCTNERPPGGPKPSCAPRGSVEIYRRFKDRVREQGLKERVLVTRTGCLKHCSLGITVGVWPGNTWYGGVTGRDVDEILEAALDNEEVERLRIPEEAPWE